MLNDVVSNMNSVEYSGWDVQADFIAHENVHVTHTQSDITRLFDIYVAAIEGIMLPCRDYSDQAAAIAALKDTADYKNATIAFLRDVAKAHTDDVQHKKKDDFIEAQRAALAPWKEAIKNAAIDKNCF